MQITRDAEAPRTNINEKLFPVLGLKVLGRGNGIMSTRFEVESRRGCSLCHSWGWEGARKTHPDFSLSSYPLCVGTGWCWFMRANFMQLFPTLVSSWQFEISHGGSIYITEMGKCYKSGCFSLERWLINIYWHKFTVSHTLISSFCFSLANLVASQRAKELGWKSHYGEENGRVGRAAKGE